MRESAIESEWEILYYMFFKTYFHLMCCPLNSIHSPIFNFFIFTKILTIQKHKRNWIILFHKIKSHFNFHSVLSIIYKKINKTNLVCFHLKLSFKIMTEKCFRNGQSIYQYLSSFLVGKFGQFELVNHQIQTIFCLFMNHDTFFFLVCATLCARFIFAI